MLIGKAPGDPKPVVTRAGDRVVRRSLDFHEAVGRRLAAAPPVATASALIILGRRPRTRARSRSAGVAGPPPGRRDERLRERPFLVGAGGSDSV